MNLFIGKEQIKRTLEYFKVNALYFNYMIINDYLLVQSVILMIIAAIFHTDV